MSLPPLNPEKTYAGIALDPQTLERVIPESRRPDGTVRKQIKIRPGFTPQEDVRRFRGAKQTQMDANALPKGHIIGWVPPPPASTSVSPAKSNKNAKKRARKKRAKESEREVPDNWEEDDKDDDDESGPCGPDSIAQNSSTTITTDLAVEDKKQSVPSADVEEDLSSNLDKLNVK